MQREEYAGKLNLGDAWSVRPHPRTVGTACRRLVGREGWYLVYGPRTDVRGEGNVFMAMNFLEFETALSRNSKPRSRNSSFLGSDASVNISEEIKRLQTKSRALTNSYFFEPFSLANHTVSATSSTSLHVGLCPRCCSHDWQELHGDRMYGDDLAIVGGLARLEGVPVMVIGQQKGRGYQRARAAQLRDAPNRKGIEKRCGSCKSPNASVCPSSP